MFVYQHIILRGYFQSMGGIFRASVVVEVKTNLLQRDYVNRFGFIPFKE